MSWLVVVWLVGFGLVAVGHVCVWDERPHRLARVIWRSALWAVWLPVVFAQLTLGMLRDDHAKRRERDGEPEGF